MLTKALKVILVRMVIRVKKVIRATKATRATKALKPHHLCLHLVCRRPSSLQ
jgi:hypothetical protein